MRGMVTRIGWLRFVKRASATAAIGPIVYLFVAFPLHPAPGIGGPGGGYDALIYMGCAAPFVVVGTLVFLISAVTLRQEVKRQQSEDAVAPDAGREAGADD
jgi:hypothetical protein